MYKTLEATLKKLNCNFNSQSDKDNLIFSGRLSTGVLHLSKVAQKLCLLQ